MEPASIPSPAKFTQLGMLARDCLTAGRRGKVLAAVSEAIYLITDTNDLFWIATQNAPLHRRCVSVSTSLPRPSAGSPFYVEGYTLTIDPDLTFSFDDTHIWQAPSVDPDHAVEITKLSTYIQSFYSKLNFSQTKGFGHFIPHILSLSQNSPSKSTFESTDAFLRFAQPFVLNIARACLQHTASQIHQSADALIGLGTGLTPSGDDFLGGFLFCIKILQDAYPGMNFIDVAIPIESYGSRTHLISFTLLQDLAIGHAIAPLHQIINGLLSGVSFESIYTDVSQLTAVGHSTGWDLLAGLLTGLLIVFQNPSLRAGQSNLL
jgi:hypothetical protein